MPPRVFDVQTPRRSLPIRRMLTRAFTGRAGQRVSRRGMLGFSAAAVATGLLPTLPGCTATPSFPAFCGEPGPMPEQPERWSLLSDLHLSGNTGINWGSINMAQHASAAVAGILDPGIAQAPAGVIVNGDCALEFGGSDDYRTFRDLVVEPIAERGIPLHVTLGNHDHRGRFRESLGDRLRPASASGIDAGASGRDAGGAGPPTRWAVEHRCASLVRGRYANLCLLDSLDNHHHLAGSIGRRQLEWLDGALAANRDKPAIVFGHHPIDAENNWLWGNISLLDGPDLWSVLSKHPHVKAYVYGHTHRWEIRRRGHIHLVNLPSTAYVFDPGQPSAWVDLWLGREGALLHLRRLRPGGAARLGESAALAWA